MNNTNNNIININKTQQNLFLWLPISATEKK